MCKFLKSHLLFMLCFLLILTGCTNRKISREFSHTMDDGGRVNIKIEYKPKSQISGDKKFGSYYYIVQYFYPKHVKRTSSEQQGKVKTEKTAEELAREALRLSEQQGKDKTDPIQEAINDVFSSSEQQGKVKTIEEMARESLTAELSEQQGKDKTYKTNFKWCGGTLLSEQQGKIKPYP